MSLPEGTHSIGPGNGSLRVKTGRQGAAAKAGHDLVLGVNSWEATVQGGDSPSITLTADPASIDVIEGSGGAKALTDKDKAEIKKSITSKVLGSEEISFRSTDVRNGSAKGELSIAGSTSTVDVPLNVSANTISGSVTLRQSEFGIKQFKALMGALKVSDEVTVEFEGTI